MLELVKQNIHMNRWKNQVNTQVTLDDDFIVPDTMSDIAQVILDAGEIQLDPVKVQNEKIQVRGKLEFHVLYRKEEGGLQTLGGLLPFEETVNVPGLEEKDYVSVTWQLEDLDASMINSRKLSIRGIVTLEVKVETLFDAEAAVDLKEPEWEAGSAGAGGMTGAGRMTGVGGMTGAGGMTGPAGMTGTAGTDAGFFGPPHIETERETLEVAAIALRRKDTYRLKESITLSGSKPAIDRILWTEMRLCGASARPLDGRIHLEGSLLVFVIYEGEGENSTVQWMEESLPFSGEVEMPGAAQEMLPAIGLRLIHRGIEEKPDYDGEMRELDVDAVVELDIRLYEERPLELLSDLYATNRELTMETGEACFDQLLTRNSGKCKVAEKVELGGDMRILQICHSSGTVKLDEVTAGKDVLVIDGALEVQILYLTDDDSLPIQATSSLLPFHYEAEAPGIREDSIWYLENGVEQLTAVMAGGGTVEIKGVLTLELLALQPVCRQVILRADTAPMDRKQFQEMPGLVGYVVQEGDRLWTIAKRFRTTVDNVMASNGLASEEVKPGDTLLLIKEMSR
ncbi:MAG TPA: DUF3794 domain-containing protein [Candidatus Ventrimonas merdavium]|nr:DUF3794 domain-containing protein [Candidatus Ventrimonas merdavium]